jgi:hypothetical protein
MKELEIRKEIKEFLDTLPPTIPFEEREENYYFNNFHLNLPGKSSKRNNMEQGGYLDDSRLVRGNGKTLREFYKDIDNALEESGINLIQLEELMKDASSLETRKKIFKLCFPAYVLLRQRGYTKSDLTK